MKRNSNFELLRILCMIFIVFGHLMGQGIGLDNLSLANTVFAHFVGSLSRISVNLFVMTSAWFMMEKGYKTERVLKIYVQTWSYSVILTVLSFICGGAISKGAIVNMLFPFIRMSVWYVTVHISLMLISPFLNYIKEWNEKKLKCSVLVLLLLTSVMSTIKGLQENYLSWLMWFIFIYIFIIYLKQFALKYFESIKPFVFLFSGVCVYSIVIAIKIWAFQNNLSIYYILSQWLSDSKSLIDFLIAGCIFIFFVKLNIGSNKNINFIASSSFSVYVFHQIPAFYPILWFVILKVSAWRNSLYMPFIAIFAVVMIYVVGTIFNLVYKYTLEAVLIKNRIARRIISKVDELYDFD